MRAVKSLARRALLPLIEALDRATRMARARDGATRFLVGGARPSDLPFTRLYFGAAAWHWGDLSAAPDHLESFEAGLARCREPRRVLDIGTGAGGSAAAIARRFPEAEVVAVDVSKRMLARARRLHAAPNLTFRHASAGKLPFPDASFDLVTLHNAVPEMHPLRRVLRPQGEVMAASTYSPLGERSHSVRGRWLDFHFEPVDSADVGRGAWELYRLQADAPPPPFI
jgi:SAM-dependent methyltransferase